MIQRYVKWISIVLTMFVIFTGSLFQTIPVSAHDGGDGTTTPIKHVIVIIGENHSFDNVFGVFQPPKGQKVNNLLSEGIVTCRGQSGSQARWYQRWASSLFLALTV